MTALFDTSPYRTHPSAAASAMIHREAPGMIVQAMANACPLDPALPDPSPDEVNQWLRCVDHLGLVVGHLDGTDPREARATFRAALGILLDSTRPGWRPAAWGNWGRA